MQASLQPAAAFLEAGTSKKKSPDGSRASEKGCGTPAALMLALLFDMPAAPHDASAESDQIVRIEAPARLSANG